ncbi:hypothetical protein BH18ACI4_BH18ACI4_14320 [soil metagenome]
MAANANPSPSAISRVALRPALLTFRHKAKFGDFVMLLYIAAFVRQFLWLIDNQVIAWVLTAVLTLALWLLHLTKKDFESQKTPPQFWLIVAPPLLLIFAMRAALPDTSFDVLNYRLVNAERGLGGWPFRAGDFFPAFYPLNPAPDMLLGISRHLLGYRLGTITNLLVLLWVGTILEKFIRPYVVNRWLRTTGVLLILWTEHALFLVNNYMVDLLAIPLLLLATQIALQPGTSELKQSPIRLGLYLGASVALKLSNLAYCIPIILVYSYSLLSGKRAQLRLALAAAWIAIGSALPLLPYSLYIWRDTGNPVFPFYNTIFHSPFWPNSNLGDGRWGPNGLWETIIWPVRVTLKPERFGELAVYSGRISIVFIVAILVLVWPNLDRHLRLLGFVAFSGTLLWAAMLMGYARYAVFVEMLGGLTLLGFAAPLFATDKQQQTQRARLLKVGLSHLLLCALVAQCFYALTYIARYEWSMRPTIFEDPSNYRAEARYILRDYDLAKFLTPAERQPLTNVGMWIESGMLTSGVQSLLTRHAPILCAYVDDYFHSAEGRGRFARALRQGGNQRIASLCLESELDSCRHKLARRKIEIVDVLPVQIPVYSGRRKLKMVLLTLSLPPYSESQSWLIINRPKEML